MVVRHLMKTMYNNCNFRVCCCCVVNIFVSKPPKGGNTGSGPPMRISILVLCLCFKMPLCVIITISHLLLLFISSFTDAPYASLFVIVYTYAYSTQSPNIALLSCLLRTLGIVIHLHAQYTSCLLRTLAV